MKQPKIRILVADDHPVVRDGIVSIVEFEKDMQVFAQRHSPAHASGNDTAGASRQDLHSPRELDKSLWRI